MKGFLGLLLFMAATSLFALDKVSAKSWIVADSAGNIIAGENKEEQHSIASITKLMTAMVVLDAGQDLNQLIKHSTRRDLIKRMLMSSDNQAAELLCEHHPKERSGCIKEMNTKAMMLGLKNTKYVDPSGLGVMNISTAVELITVVLEASKYPEIVSASNTFQDTVKNKRKSVNIYNTNPLVRTKDFIVSKTGYIRAAGGCIVVMTYDRIVILLGSKNTHTRIPEILTLLEK